MPKFVLKDAVFIWDVDASGSGPVDLSDHIESLVINYTTDVPEITSMGDNARRRVFGLTDFSIDVTFRQDYDAGEVDATFFDEVGSAAEDIEIRPTSAAVSPTNPKFTGNVLLAAYNPVGGSVADVAGGTISLMGDGTLTRATA